MLDRNAQTNFPKLTCSNCGQTTHFRLPGITERTRYTCPRCCERISLQRGICQRSPNPFSLREEPEVRQIALRHEICRSSRAEADDIT
jgi:hypothetical protein